MRMSMAENLLHIVEGQRLHAKRRRQRGGEKEDALLDVGVHALDGDLAAALAVDGAVHLRQARDADRLGVEAAEEVGHGRARLGEEELLEGLERRREALVLERLHGLRPGERHKLDRRQVLAELHEVERASAWMSSGREPRRALDEENEATHLDVDAAELSHGLHEPRRRLAVRLLVVVVALGVTLVRLVPRLAEQGLVVHDAARDGPGDDRAPFDGDDAVLDGRAELVGGKEDGERDEEAEEDALPAGFWSGQSSPHDAEDVALELGEARVDSRLAGERRRLVERRWRRRGRAVGRCGRVGGWRLEARCREGERSCRQVRRRPWRRRGPGQGRLGAEGEAICETRRRTRSAASSLSSARALLTCTTAVETGSSAAELLRPASRAVPVLVSHHDAPGGDGGEARTRSPCGPGSGTAASDEPEASC